jgi:hypothetical protein
MCIYKHYPLLCFLSAISVDDDDDDDDEREAGWRETDASHVCDSGASR